MMRLRNTGVKIDPSLLLPAPKDKICSVIVMFKWWSRLNTVTCCSKTHPMHFFFLYFSSIYLYPTWKRYRLQRNKHWPHQLSLETRPWLWPDRDEYTEEEELLEFWLQIVPLHLAPGILSPPTSFLKQQETVFLAGRSSLEPVPWRQKWQKKQDGECGWGWYPALVRLLLENSATVVETLWEKGW